MNKSNGQLDPFNLDTQFNVFLRLKKVSNRDKLNVNKMRPLREAFIGGVTQMLMLMQNDLPNMRDPKKIEAKINDLVRQIRKYFEHDQEITKLIDKALVDTGSK